jgi:hypothetical protein
MPLPHTAPSFRAVAAPRDSVLQAQLSSAWFHDSYETSVRTEGKTALQLYIDVVAGTPAWMDFLMVTRNRIVGFFGLKNIGRFTDIDRTRAIASYKVGDRVGIFSIWHLSDDEVVMRDDDKHLDAKVSVFRYPDAEGRVGVTTVVHVKNFLGRAYLFFVVPAHKVLVPLMLARVSKSQVQV